jgi:hypothetical protein
MQNPHKVMHGIGYFGREKGQRKGRPFVLRLKKNGFLSDKDAGRFQAIEMAMKASRNIKTAPAKGKTIGIIGTMESTTSSSTAGTSWACASWVE